MNLSFDYSMLIREIKDELDKGDFTLMDNIYILRNEKPIADGYRPVIDWYYNEDVMKRITKPHIFDHESDVIEKKSILQQYIKDKPKLEKVSIGKILIELDDWNKLL